MNTMNTMNTMNMTTLKSPQFYEGVTAHITWSGAGSVYDAALRLCPYDAHTPEALNWQRGFMDAAEAEAVAECERVDAARQLTPAELAREDADRLIDRPSRGVFQQHPDLAGHIADATPAAEEEADDPLIEHDSNGLA